MTEIREVGLDEVRVDGVQARVGIRRHAVAEYAEALREGAVFPPAVAFDDGASLWLSAGHHRREAYRLAGRDAMPMEIRQGSKLDVLLFAAKDNLGHKAERLSRQDKRHAVRLVLLERPQLSDRAVADGCGVTHSTVAGIRRDLEVTGQISQSPTRVGQDGRAIDVSNVGRGAADKASGRQDESQPVAPAVDRCPCGSEWLSTGEPFSRFCPACRADHPGDAEQREALALQEVESQRVAEPVRPAEVSAAPEARRMPPAKAPEHHYADCVRGLGDVKRAMDALSSLWPGPNYTVCMAAANRLSDELQRWKKEGQAAPQGGDDGGAFPF